MINKRYILIGHTLVAHTGVSPVLYQVQLNTVVQES